MKSSFLRLEQHIESSRSDFEHQIHLEYFIRGVRIRPNKQFWDVTHQLTQEELCVRDERGQYTDDGVAAAWIGWKLAWERHLQEEFDRAVERDLST